MRRRENVAAAIGRQALRGGKLGDILIELGSIDRAAYEAFAQRLPPEPIALKDIGIAEPDLIDLLMKLVYVGRLETLSQFTDAIKLPHGLVVELVGKTVERHLLQAAGSHGQIGFVDMQYYLTDSGQHFIRMRSRVRNTLALRRFPSTATPNASAAEDHQ